MQRSRRGSPDATQTTVASHASRLRRGRIAASVSRVVDVRGFAFRVTTSRPNAVPAAAPLRRFVLVHGIGISSRAFARLHVQLAADAEVHSIDLPGFGGLPKPERSPDVPEMASLLGVVVDWAVAAAGPVVATGISMGAQWVVELARQRPDLVSHVVAIGPVADDTRRDALRQGLALLADSTREPASANAMVLSDYLRCGPRWYGSQLPHMLGYRIEDAVTELARPLLVVRGERDPIASAQWCGRLRDAAPRALLLQLAGQPHLAQHTAPRAVAHAIRRFVEVDGEAPAEAEAEVEAAGEAAGEAAVAREAAGDVESAVDDRGADRAQEEAGPSWA